MRKGRRRNMKMHEHEFLREAGQTCLLVGEHVFLRCTCGARLVQQIVAPGLYRTVAEEGKEETP